MNVSYEKVENVYSNMPNSPDDYSAVNFNCSHWANRFYHRGSINNTLENIIKLKLNRYVKKNKHVCAKIDSHRFVDKKWRYVSYFGLH